MPQKKINNIVCPQVACDLGAFFLSLWWKIIIFEVTIKITDARMNVLLLQTDIKWEAPVYNRDRAVKMIDAATSQPDLIVLPEMFTTGFCMSPESIAEETDSDTLAWMRATAERKSAAVAASVVTMENGNYYNRFYFVKPDGSYAVYDKRHLFTFGGEHEKYTAGENRVIVQYGGFRILLQICYDLRFPVFSRNTGDYDMIIYIASWPVPRIEVWNTLLKARAIENVCYVVGVNRVGKDPYCDYNGGTALIDYLGKPLVTAEWGKEEAVSASINKDDLINFRKKFPALQDADQFRIIK